MFTCLAAFTARYAAGAVPGFNVTVNNVLVNDAVKSCCRLGMLNKVQIIELCYEFDLHTFGVRICDRNVSTIFM